MPRIKQKYHIHQCLPNGETRTANKSFINPKPCCCLNRGHTSAFGGKIACEPRQEHAETLCSNSSPCPGLSGGKAHKKQGWELPPSILLLLGGRSCPFSTDGKPTTPCSPTAPAAFSGIPKFGRSLFLQHTPLHGWTPA